MTFETPDFFRPVEESSGRTYRQWLSHRARQLLEHDRRKSYHVHPADHYRKAIDTAVRHSGGLDEYSGDAIDWSLAFSHRCEKKGGRFRRLFAAAPSVDHLTGGGLTVAICRDDTNSAKGCMTAEQFRTLCRKVAANGAFFGVGSAAPAPHSTQSSPMSR